MSAVACPDAIMAPMGSGRPPQLFGPSTAGEVALLRAARETRPEVDYSGCTRDLLAELSRRRGIDFATAFFYDRISRLAGNRLLFHALGDPRFDGETPFARGRVLIVPALFFRERPEIGGDGAVIARVAEVAGLEARVLPVRRWLFTAFLERDLVPLAGMELHTGNALAAGGPMATCAEWMLQPPRAVLREPLPGAASARSEPMRERRGDSSCSGNRAGSLLRDHRRFGDAADRGRAAE